MSHRSGPDVTFFGYFSGAQLILSLRLWTATATDRQGDESRVQCRAHRSPSKGDGQRRPGEIAHLSNQRCPNRVMRSPIFTLLLAVFLHIPCLATGQTPLPAEQDPNQLHEATAVPTASGLEAEMSNARSPAFQSQALRDRSASFRSHCRPGRSPLKARPDSTGASRKSPGWALAYSLGGTVLLAPFGVGLVAGPAAGHFYAGDSRQAWTGIAVRGGATLAAGTGLVLAAGSIPAPVIGAGGPPLGDWAGPVGLGLMAAGISVGLGSLVYDIATAPGSAAEHNRAHGVSIRAAPIVEPRSGQKGLALRIRF